MSQRTEDIIAEIERRRDARDGICDSCLCAGGYEGEACIDCLGQKILLSADEYGMLLVLGDSIVDAGELQRH